MKIYKLLMLFVFIYGSVIYSLSQDTKVKLYNPKLDASQQIDNAVALAKKENKHVLLQIGGNWCGWCIMLHKFYAAESQIDSILKKDYVVEYINFSKENKNLETLKNLEYPQRFGFPVLVILDGNGKRLHTQNTVYLEQGRGYSKKRVFEFLKNWKPSALDPATYKE
jgi:thioredoxin-related protein